MVDEKIIDYIKEGLARGFDMPLLKRKLLDAGYEETDILEAINTLNRRVPSASRIHMIKTPSGINEEEVEDGEIEEDKEDIFKKTIKKQTH